MKLNPDCIRDIMMELEKQTSAGEVEFAGVKTDGFIGFSPKLMTNNIVLNKYSYNEIVYHTIQLSESGYIVTDYQFDPTSRSPLFHLNTIYYITPMGHELLSKIESDSSWKDKIKPITDKFSSISLSIIESVATGVVNAYINKLICP